MGGGFCVGGDARIAPAGKSVFTEIFGELHGSWVDVGIDPYEPYWEISKIP